MAQALAGFIERQKFREFGGGHRVLDRLANAPRRGDVAERASRGLATSQDQKHYR